jgi:hypothetical protein
MWPFHGIFGSGPTLDETFGLIDTAEKSSEVIVWNGHITRLCDCICSAVAAPIPSVPGTIHGRMPTPDPG